MLAVLLALAVVLEVVVTMAAATSASTTLTITGNRSSRGGNNCICITFSYCGQFSLHWIECWHELCWVWNCSVNRTDLKLFRRQILWLEPFKINNNNKKLLDLWTECDNQPTDGTDETRINQKINTNRDDTEEKIEVREPFMTLKSIETQEVTQKGALPWRTDQLNFSVDIYIYTYIEGSCYVCDT